MCFFYVNLFYLSTKIYHSEFSEIVVGFFIHWFCIWSKDSHAWCILEIKGQLRYDIVTSNSYLLVDDSRIPSLSKNPCNIPSKYLIFLFELLRSIISVHWRRNWSWTSLFRKILFSVITIYVSINFIVSVHSFRVLSYTTDLQKCSTKR